MLYDVPHRVVALLKCLTADAQKAQYSALVPGPCLQEGLKSVLTGLDLMDEGGELRFRSIGDISTWREVVDEENEDTEEEEMEESPLCEGQSGEDKRDGAASTDYARSSPTGYDGFIQSGYDGSILGADAESISGADAEAILEPFEGSFSAGCDNAIPTGYDGSIPTGLGGSISGAKAEGVDDDVEACARYTPAPVGKSIDESFPTGYDGLIPTGCDGPTPTGYDGVPTDRDGSISGAKAIDVSQCGDLRKVFPDTSWRIHRS
jgi:hypothetical protein